MKESDEEINSRLHSQNPCHDSVSVFYQEHNDWNIQNCHFTYSSDDCESLFLTLMEEHRLNVFENRVLRRIFGRKREKNETNWRLEFQKLYSSLDMITVTKSRRGEPASRPYFELVLIQFTHSHSISLRYILIWFFIFLMRVTCPYSEFLILST
jgi:hypothetical protein